MNFGELKNDSVIKDKVINVHKSVDSIKNVLEVFQNKNIYNSLEPLDKVDYDLFLSYTLNTLYWIYLRTKGIDPNKNDIKNELNRVRQYMVKAKDAKERITLRPRLNKDVSQRIVRNAVWDIPAQPPNKKRKFEED